MNENSNSSLFSEQSTNTSLSDSLRKPKSWAKLKSIVEFSRKLVYSLNSDVPSNINFRKLDNNEYRVYFLAGTQKRDITIKYINVRLGNQCDKLTANTIFSNTPGNGFSLSNEKQQLTKEEQLLRERKRCSLSGITSYFVDCDSGRLVFSERSELFVFNDEIPNIKCEYPIEVSTVSKGAIDVQICPINSDLISYVLNDNLWIQDLSTKEEIQLTKTCDPIKSGVPSYAVQEEFNRYTGYWWQPTKQVNPDDSVTYRIVYEEVDDSSVDLTYITPSCVNEFGYDQYRYPKAGTPNSKIYLKMIEITFSKDKKVNFVEKKMFKNFYDLFNWYEYLVRADWTPDGQSVWVQIFDRLQCHSATVLIPLDYFVVENNELVEEMQTSTYDTPNVYCILEQISDTWINVHNTMHFLNLDNEQDANKYISFITANDETGFLHLYHYKISLENENFTKVSDGILKSNFAIKRQLTDGNWCVEYDENVQIDQVNHLVYFTGYQNPLESHFYVVNYNDPLKVKQLTKTGFSHAVKMNKETNLFTTICSNLGTSYKTYIYQIENQDKGLENLTVTQLSQIISREESKTVFFTQPFQTSSNSERLSKLTINSLLNLNIDSILSSTTPENEESTIIKHLFKPPQTFAFFTDDNCKLYGMIYLPHNFEPGVKYPTVLYVYGGPKAQIVTNSYKASKYSRFNILALLDYCVVVIDSRGSDYRGLEFESHLKKRMGTVEISDQVKGLEAAAGIFNCIDMKRIGIYGWSYGGYMALMGLAQRPDIFKVAISGAPVTTWNLYDTAYTERYMGLPDENKEAYNKGSVINCAKLFPDEENRLLIIHGMIDENVHFAHTRQFIDALVKENKPYQLQVYPNERHGIRSPEASVHCDINFFSFLEQNLKN